MKLFFTLVFQSLLLFGLADLKKAKVGECYKKVIIPAKYDIKEELIEVEKSSSKIIVKDAKFKTEKKKIKISPSYQNIIAKEATFIKKSIKLPIKKKKIYYTLKNSDIELDKNYIDMVKKSGLDLNNLKINECYTQYIKFLEKEEIQKSYEKKQAYEIIDVAPPVFKTIKKKVLIKPAYIKIIKTPPIYKTKIFKVLLSPEIKEFKEIKGGTVCVIKKEAKYKTITKKILLEPAKTKIIQFPATYKEIDIKVMSKPPIVTRRVIPSKKENYMYEIGRKKRYFWSKDDLTDGIKTGLSICKKVSPEEYKSFDIEVVKTPATTIEKEVKAKTIELNVEKKIEDANTTTITLPPQYERVKTKVLLSPSQIYWEKVKCNP